MADKTTPHGDHIAGDKIGRDKIDTQINHYHRHYLANVKLGKMSETGNMTKKTAVRMELKKQAESTGGLDVRDPRRRGISRAAVVGLKVARIYGAVSTKDAHKNA